MIWCILIPLLTAIIGAILGWLLRHLTCKCDEFQDEIDALKARNIKLTTELADCKDNLGNANLNIGQSNLKASSLGLASNVAAETVEIAAEPALVFDASGAKAIFGKKVIADDLKVVEGIGPKISELFHNNGITTWYQLSKASVQRCQEVLNTGGKRFEIHKPDTWPKQAGLAFDGKWQELKDLQDYLDGGKERS